jgi:hypothetical protein
MIFSNSKTIEDKIIELCLKDRVSVQFLHHELRKQEQVSLRAVYKAVDKLLKIGVLVKAGRRLSADAEWVRRVSQGLSADSVLVPGIGERMTHTFTSLERLDAFWKTIVLPVEESIKNPEVFFYNPHNFWAYVPGRVESEQAYYGSFSHVKKTAFFTVGGETDADQEFKKSYQSSYLQIDTRDIKSLRRTDHITVIGSLIITAKLSKKAAFRLDQLYSSGKSIKDILPDVLEIFDSKEKIRCILENDKVRAQKLRKTLSKNFYFAI